MSANLSKQLIIYLLQTWYSISTNNISASHVFRV